MKTVHSKVVSESVTSLSSGGDLENFGVTLASDLEEGDQVGTRSPVAN